MTAAPRAAAPATHGWIASAILIALLVATILAAAARAAETGTPLRV